MHLVLMGQSGSGKTTLAKAIEARMNVPHISSGDIARTLAETDENTRIALNQGMPAPEEALRRHVRRALEQADATRGGWVLEGFPRHLEQLVCLMQWVPMPAFFVLDVPVVTCIERLIDRDRADDNPDSIARKIKSFAERTQPLIDALAGSGHLDVAMYNPHAPQDADSFDGLVEMAMSVGFKAR